MTEKTLTDTIKSRRLHEIQKQKKLFTQLLKEAKNTHEKQTYKGKLNTLQKEEQQIKK